METIKREKYVDVVAGIMISWMILGHCIHFSHFGLSLYKYGSFFMPWFFYKSGMFFMPRQRTDLMKKDANKLLRTLVVYFFIGWVVWCACGIIDGSLSFKGCIILPIQSFLIKGSFKGNGALWFLLSIFIVRQFSNIILGKLTPPHYICNMFFVCLYTLCIRVV